MRKFLTSLLVCLLSVSLAACQPVTRMGAAAAGAANNQANTPKETVNIAKSQAGMAALKSGQTALKVDTAFTVTSQDKDYIFADILIKNTTAYQFSSDEVSVMLVPTAGHNEAYSIGAFFKEERNPKEWIYQVKIPKTLLTSLPAIDPNRITLAIKGWFYDPQKLQVISGLNQREEINLR
jgi:hypothetical protein